MLKLNHPHLGVGLPRTSQGVFDPNDRGAVQSTIHVVDSICHSAQLITSSSGGLSFVGPLVPTLAHSMFLAAKMLVISGGAVAQGGDSSAQIQLLRSSLEVLAKRWKIAGRCAANVTTGERPSEADEQKQIDTCKC